MAEQDTTQQGNAQAEQDNEGVKHTSEGGATSNQAGKNTGSITQSEVEKLRAELADAKKKAEAGEEALKKAETLENQYKSLTERARAEEKQKEEATKAEIGSLIDKFKPFDANAYKNLKPEEREVHILKTVIPFESVLKKLDLNEKKEVIAYAVSKSSETTSSSKAGNSLLGNIIVQSKLEENKNNNFF